MLFSLLIHYLDTDTAVKVSQSVYYFTTSISHGVENYFPRLWGTGISDAIFRFIVTDATKLAKNIWEPIVENVIILGFLIADMSLNNKKCTHLVIHATFLHYTVQK